VTAASGAGDTPAHPRSRLQFICRVDGVFQLSGRQGVVLVPGFPAGSSPCVSGSDLVILQPDGSMHHTRLMGTERLTGPNGPYPTPLEVAPIEGVDVVPGALLYAHIGG